MSSSPARRMGLRVVGVLAGFVAFAVLVMVVQALSGNDPAGSARSSGSGGSASSTRPPPPGTQTPPSPIPPIPPVSDAQRATLPESTTFTTVRGLQQPRGVDSDGHVVRIAREQVGFRSPGGAPATRIPARQIGLDTWLPIVDRRPGWLQVRLPSRPNGSVTWIPAAGLRTAQTDWRVRIDLGAGTMSVTEADVSRGSWPIGQGKAATPTPVGQTFLLAGFVDPGAQFSPVIYALGAHSDTLDSFGGGPGTVAVHGWPTTKGRSGKISHGCVRVPSAALAIFGKLPTGTPVDITAG